MRVPLGLGSRYYAVLSLFYTGIDVKVFKVMVGSTRRGLRGKSLFPGKMILSGLGC